MTPETMGVENIKEILDAVLDGVDLGKAVLADGKVDLGDVASLFGALPKIIADVSLAVKDGAMVVPEVKDLQPEELASLAAHVMGRLAVADAHAVKIVEASLKIVGDVVGLVKAIQG